MTNKIKSITVIIIITISFIGIFLFMKDHDTQEKITTKLIYNTVKIPDLATITPVINTVILKNDLQNKVTMLTFLGSWCQACTVELPILKNYVRKKIAIYGMDFDEQTKKDLIRWLKIHKSEDIFNKISYDNNDTLAIDLGVTGAPESFIINKKGEIVLHIVGIITRKLWTRKILPFINTLNNEDSL